MIETLIDKLDNIEITLNQIVAILKLESVNQAALAVTDGKNAALWEFDVFSKVSNPLEMFLTQHGEDIREKPAVNVFYDSDNYADSRSTGTSKQSYNVKYVIDIYGFGVAKDNPSGGHFAGDVSAFDNALRVKRLVRNILSAAEYRYLGLQGIVSNVTLASNVVYTPQINERPSSRVMAIRLDLNVVVNEFSPQHVEDDTISTISNSILRTEDGEVLINTDFVFTPGK